MLVFKPLSCVYIGDNASDIDSNSQCLHYGNKHSKQAHFEAQKTFSMLKKLEQFSLGGMTKNRNNLCRVAQGGQGK